MPEEVTGQTDSEPVALPDPLGDAVAAFLSDLLDNVSVEVHTDVDFVARTTKSAS